MFGGKKDSRPTAAKREELTYYENRFEDGGDVDDELTEMYMELFADYSEQGMDAREAHTAAAKVLPAKELTEQVSLKNANGETEKVELDARQIVKYAEAKSKAGYEMYMDLFDSRYTDEQRAQIATKVDDYADAVAVRSVLEEEPDDWYGTVLDAIDGGMSELDALATVLFAKEVEGTKNANGETMSGSKLQNQLDYLKRQKMSNSQKAAVLYGLLSDAKQNYFDEALKAGADPWVTAQYMVFCATVTSDKTADGKTKSGSKKAKVEAEIQRLGVKGRVAEIYLKAAGY